MDTTSPQITVRLSADLRRRIEAKAREQQCSPSEVIRRAVSSFLTQERAADESDLRHRRISEFTQLCVDTLIRENHPDKIEAIVLETGRRMERYHGAR